MVNEFFVKKTMVRMGCSFLLAPCLANQVVGLLIKRRSKILGVFFCWRSFASLGYI